MSTRPPVVAAAIAAGKGAAPMFVQFVMEPLCAIYREILVEQNLPKMQKMIERLELKIPARDLMSKEFRPKLQARVGGGGNGTKNKIGILQMIVHFLHHEIQ